MIALTIKMPDETYARLRDLARARGVSINKFIEELATATLSAHDAEVRFRLMAARGNSKRTLAILERLNVADGRKELAEAKGPLRVSRRTVTKK